MSKKRQYAVFKQGSEDVESVPAKSKRNLDNDSELSENEEE